jgi:two-component system, chemotaxis family, chemotaxis protein CheY
MSKTDLSVLAVLVLDDNKHMRRLIRSMLRAFGVIDVHEATGAAHAMALLHGVPFDVAIIDQMLLPTDGLDFVRRLRSAEDSPNPLLPAIMMTAHATREVVSAARDAGVNEFLAKPVAPKALAQRLWSIIMRPRPFVRTSVYFGPCRRRHMPDGWDGADRRATMTEPMRVAS